MRRTTVGVSAGPRRPECDVAIVGAGPYGLAAAAHLREVPGLEVRIFGEPMSFWESMPRGMLLRSAWEACHIGFPSGSLTLDSYLTDTRRQFTKPVPLDEFIRYGHWFQSKAVPAVERTRVTRVSRDRGRFRLLLANDEPISAGRVVIAAGIDAFASRPQVFDALPSELVTHSSEHRNLGDFSGRCVLVIGGGQSALESAALLHEAGADVEVIARKEQIIWLHGGSTQRKLGRFKPLFYAQTDVGPLALSRLVAVPRLFTSLPQDVQDRLAYRAIRPAGARWLVDRVAAVPISTGREVVGAEVTHDRVRLTLDDGSHRTADHVILGTGYKIDVGEYDFLSPELLSSIRRINGYPILRTGLRTSVPGLHILGAPAARSYGPTMRFVSGSWYAARALTRSVRASAGAYAR